jgi:hypothetical protein
LKGYLKNSYKGYEKVHLCRLAGKGTELRVGLEDSFLEHTKIITLSSLEWLEAIDTEQIQRTE